MWLFAQYKFNNKTRAKAPDLGSAKRAQEILEMMEKLYEEGDEGVKPDVITYNAGTFVLLSFFL